MSSYSRNHILNTDEQVFPRRNLKNHYDWNKLLSEKKRNRNRWLVTVWMELYIKYPHDEYIRKLPTTEMDETKWFEKYGYKEPIF